MIIRDLHLDGFGHFRDYSMEGLGKGVNIILGNNEAGKSTLLKFIRYTLFGYPRLVANRMPPLKGGTHGGRIRGLLSSEKEVVIERNGSDKISFVYGSQQFQDESMWFELLGNATSSLFNNIYAFTLDELVSLSSLNESGVEDKIFSLGLGLGGMSIGDVENTLRKMSDNIYTQKGRTQLVPSVLHQMDLKKGKIREIQKKLHLYEQYAAQIADLEKQKEGLETKMKSVDPEKQKLETSLKCYESFLNLQQIDDELRELPALRELPGDGEFALEKDLEKARELDEEMDNLKNGQPEDPGIVELNERISRIEVNQQLLSQKDTITFLRKNLEKYRQNSLEIEEEKRQINSFEQAIKSGVEKIDSRWTEENIVNFTDVIFHKSQITRLKDAADALNHSERDYQAELKALETRESIVNPGMLIVFAAVGFIIASSTAFYYGVYVLGSAMAAIALLLLMSRTHFTRKNPTAVVREKLNHLHEQQQDLDNKLSTYLKEELGLENPFSPQAALEVLNTIEQLKKEVAQKNKLLEKLKTLRLPFAEEFEDKTSLTRQFVNDDGSVETPGKFAEKIIIAFDENTEKILRKQRLEYDLQLKTRELQQLESQYRQTKTSILDRIQLIGASGKEDFYRIYKQDQRVKELLNQRKQTESTIEKIAGYGKTPEVVSFLIEHDKQTLEVRLREFTTRQNELEEQKQDVTSQLGGKKADLKRLEGESELAEVATALESDREKLRIARKDWMAAKMALHMLDIVKGDFEKEKQPEVIKFAGMYFRQITGGRYTGLRTLLEGKELHVVDEKEQFKTLGQLSRGTREQLLISLRLGLIHEYERHSEPLPVIMDEVLVNFDNNRAKSIAEIISDFARQRQVMLFTCHPTSVKLFDSDRVNIIRLP